MSRRGQLIRRGETIEMPDGRLIQSFSFRHVLFQEVACDRQGAARRTKSHAAVAERLGNIFAAHLALVASALAYHYVHAGLWPQAIRFLRMTARTAMQRFALREASTLLEQAIQLCRNLPTNERGLTELELLEELAHIYLGRFDLRAEAAYQRLTRLAHDVGRVDVEARAMIGLGYFISWTDRDRSLDVMSCALSRSTAVVDPVQRARIRCSAHGWRSWAQGWNAGDADGFEVAIEELRNLGDPVALAASQVEHSLILFPSARYMEATDSVDIGFATLLEHVLDAWVDLSLPLWMIRLGPPWALMSAGRFGDALERFASGFAAFENNGDVRRGATLRLYHAFVFERMHDHQAALNILDDTVARIKEGNISFSPNEVTIELVIRGLAQLGLGQVEIALEHLKAARAEMDARDTLTSWYWRLAGEWGMTDALLLTGDLVEAEACAHKFQERACAIEERSWRALAAEACARVALAAENPMRARTYLAQAWGEIKGYDAALVRWRLYSVDASISDKFADTQSASRHRKSQADELEALAASLPTNHASRDLLLMAQPISSSSAALCPQTSVGEALRSMTDGLPPLLGQNVDARPLA
ncbi:hypothetical protein AX768_31065 (plasmid) [Burkholderia sp. PAMC 28687]|uniref:hypothetical protein n=1 Tax=Burkholderia sp. PAMC 28687 TaxID=1795874 RepID=UPI00078345CD|nr:hypothetical protein [Burkholderia sp. PAMC 28687]AMM18692.1 hypothetical protein AX768_31065 [Burkholderia sp. PAMC 28687]